MKLMQFVAFAVFMMGTSAMAEEYTCHVFEDKEEGEAVGEFTVDTAADETSHLNVVGDHHAVCAGADSDFGRLLVCVFGELKKADSKAIALDLDGFEISSRSATIESARFLYLGSKLADDNYGIACISR